MPEGAGQLGPRPLMPEDFSAFLGARLPSPEFNSTGASYLTPCSDTPIRAANP
jgi:hypothetical protein